MTNLALDTPILARQYEDLSDKQYNHGKLLIQDLELAPGSQVLDVGSGTGRLTEYVADLLGPTAQVVGIDPLPLRIEIARRKAKDTLSFRVGRAEDLSDFADASFDAVYLNSVFHWLPEKTASLAEALRVLKPGGRIGISTASKERPHSLEKVVRSVLDRPPYNAYPEVGGTTPHRVTLHELRELLVSTGFGVKSIEIRAFVDRFDRPQEVIDFSTSSSFGNFLSKLPDNLRTLATEEVKAELEKQRRQEGIILTRNLIFAVGEKPTA